MTKLFRCFSIIALVMWFAVPASAFRPVPPVGTPELFFQLPEGASLSCSLLSGTISLRPAQGTVVMQYAFRNDADTPVSGLLYLSIRRVASATVYFNGKIETKSSLVLPFSIKPHEDMNLAALYEVSTAYTFYASFGISRQPTIIGNRFLAHFSESMLQRNTKDISEKPPSRWNGVWRPLNIYRASLCLIAPSDFSTDGTGQNGWRQLPGPHGTAFLFFGSGPIASVEVKKRVEVKR